MTTCKRQGPHECAIYKEHILRVFLNLLLVLPLTLYLQLHVYISTVYLSLDWLTPIHLNLRSLTSFELFLSVHLLLFFRTPFSCCQEGSLVLYQKQKVLAMSLSGSVNMATRDSFKKSDGFKTRTESYFLNIPREVRDRIYEAIRNDINSQGHIQLSQRPSTGFEGLWHVNRLIYHEVPQVLGTFAVPHKMVKTFLNRPITSHSAWNNFRFLYIEVPHNSDADTFRRLSHALKQVSHELRDLRLYGVGNDAHGRYTSSQTKACGKFDNSLFPRQANLAVSGQNWQLKLPLINAMQHLVGLRTLVLDNLNVPLSWLTQWPTNLICNLFTLVPITEPLSIPTILPIQMQKTCSEAYYFH